MTQNADSVSRFDLIVVTYECGHTAEIKRWEAKHYRSHCFECGAPIDRSEGDRG